MIAGEMVRFAMVYPPEHELAGQNIEQEAECSRCQRKFTQQRVDRAFLNSLYKRSEQRLFAFLKTCEVMTADGDKQAWFPDRCAVCSRAQMNNVAGKEAEYAPLL